MSRIVNHFNVLGSKEDFGSFTGGEVFATDGGVAYYDGVLEEDGMSGIYAIRKDSGGNFVRMPVHLDDVEVRGGVLSLGHRGNGGKYLSQEDGDKARRTWEELGLE